MRRRAVAIVAVLTTLPLAASGSPAGADATSVAGGEAVTIHRDRFGVPHVVGETREAMAYGAGHALATDRLFETDVIRRVGQGRLSEVLGAGSDGNGNGIGDTLEADMVMRREFYDAADVDQQLGELDPEIRGLLEAFSDGFNAALAAQQANPAERSVLFTALGYEPEPWTPHHSVAVLMLFTTVSFAGEGEGEEAGNAVLLDSLMRQLGEEAGIEVWDELLLRSDPEAPAVVPFGEGPPEPFISASLPGRAQLDLASDHADALSEAATFETDVGELVRRVLDDLPVPRVGSYGLAATGHRTASGNALLFGSPQAGFLAPSLFYEMGLHAPGIDCTGFTVPGLGPFIGIGWCNGHAWTFVAGNAGDQVDLYVERLCGDLRSYEYAGKCQPMDRRVEVYVTKFPAGGEAPAVHTQTIWSTVHGPVFRVDEEAGLAFVFKRSQAGKFAQSYGGVMALNAGQSLAEVQAGLEHTTATYNTLYADDDANIAYWFTGFQPVRAQEVDHRLPTPGWTRQHEWQADRLPPEQMPHVVNPAGGILHVNQGVDTKPIAWWPRASGISVGRIGHTRADQEYFAERTALDIAAVKAANREIISDVDLITPQLHFVVQRALGDVAEGDPLSEAKALYEDWRAAGYPRVDADGDGKLDHPAITIFGGDYLNLPRSSVWERWIEKVWADDPGGRKPSASRVGRIGMTIALIEDPPMFRHAKAAGWQAQFREALAETVDELAQRFGTADLERWLTDAPEIEFTAVGLLAPDPMPVQNHGTYSQIVDLGSQEGVNVLPAGNGRADSAPDIARHELTGEFPEHFVDQIDLYVNWEFKDMLMTPAQFVVGAESVQVLEYRG